MPRHRLSLRSAVARSALALSTLTSVAFAQQARDVAMPNPRSDFDDSWFWGAKGGMIRFGTLSEGRVSAPVAGGEWLITRHKSGLLLSAEQSFFDKKSAVVDPYAKDGARTVSIRDARRYSAAALAAPLTFGIVRPYAGVGLAMLVIRGATAQGDFANQQQFMLVEDQVRDGQSFVTPFFVGGAQAQVGHVALFVQGSTSSENRRALWNKGGSSQVEAGVRYNLSTAFEK